MKKTFRLPKEFAKNWLKALNSNEYEQGEDTLVKNLDENIHDPNTCKYCCLGVAAKMSGAPLEDFLTVDMLSEQKDFFREYKIPEALLSMSDLNLAVILSNLNDGANAETLVDIKEKYPDLKFLVSTNPVHNRLKYNFKEIAEFIQLNVKFV
tara:strand:- start:1725 stop:2180 length:456 start_codon:yes stop_codon:yes gene_type:complete